MNNQEAKQTDDIVFGFDRPTDERSLVLFINKIAEPAMLKEIIPRLEDREIDAIIDLFTGIMKKHLSKKEYHHLFLGDDSH